MHFFLASKSTSPFFHSPVKAMQAKHASRSHLRWPQNDRPVVMVRLVPCTGHIEGCISQLELNQLYGLMLFEPDMVIAYDIVLAAV